MERFCAYGRLQVGGALGPLEFLQKDCDLQTIRKGSARDLLEARQIEEKKLLREREVFLQQSVTLEAGFGIRQNRLVSFEADFPNRIRPQWNGGPFSVLFLAPKENLTDFGEQQLINPVCRLKIAPEVETQARNC